MDTEDAGDRSTIETTGRSGFPSARTHYSAGTVFDQLRSGIFFRFPTVGQSPSLVAGKILPRSRRTLYSWTGQSMAPHSTGPVAAGAASPSPPPKLGSCKTYAANSSTHGHRSADTPSRSTNPPPTQLTSTTTELRYVAICTAPGTRPFRHARPLVSAQPRGSRLLVYWTYDRSPARLGRGDRRDALIAAVHRGLE
jgi:hypothetical protein